MRIAFHEIIGSEVVCDIVDDGWFPHDDVELVNPVGGQLSIRKKGESRADVSGRLQVDVAMPCGRCCRSVRTDVAADFEYDCIVGKEAPHTGSDTECREEDVYRTYLHEPVIDLGEILREQVYLALPVNVLCRQSCKGLCPQCGADLNRENCSCRSADLSSPFAILGQLKEGR